MIIGKKISSKHGFVTDFLDKHLSIPRPDYPHPTISPSGITECFRKIVGVLAGIKAVDEITPQYQRIFDNGTWVHKRWLERYLPKIGICCQIWDERTQTSKNFIETTLTDGEYWLKGQPDAVIFNPNDGLRYVFELKSAKHANFQKMIEPEQSHIWQVHLYMYLTNIPRAVILYECKDDQEIKEFIIDRDEKTEGIILQRIREVQVAFKTYKETGVLPPCENPHAKFQCRCSQLQIS